MFQIIWDNIVSKTNCWTVEQHKSELTYFGVAIAISIESISGRTLKSTDCVICCRCLPSCPEQSNPGEGLHGLVAGTS